MSKVVLAVACLAAGAAFAAPYEEIVGVKSFSGELRCQAHLDAVVKMGTIGDQAATANQKLHRQFSQRFELQSDPNGATETDRFWSGRITSASGSINDSSTLMVGGNATQKSTITGSGPLDGDLDAPNAVTLSLDLKAGTWRLDAMQPGLDAVFADAFVGEGGQLIPNPPERRTADLSHGDLPPQRLPARGTRLAASVQLKEPLTPPAGTLSDGRWDCTIDISPTGKEDLQAVIDAFAPVERGGHVRLNGASSTPKGGKITRYEWSFEDIRCAGGVKPPKAAAKKTGMDTSVQVLCPMTVRLTVYIGPKKASATAQVNVTARKWSFDYAVEPGERSHDSGAPKVIVANNKVVGGRWEGAELACAEHQRIDDAGHIIHPARNGDSWKTVGYHVKAVSDPEGPFDGMFYVDDHNLRVRRVLYINPTLLPDGRPSPHYAKTNFYQQNKKEGTDVDGYLAAIRAHELEGSKGMKGHSALLREAVEKSRLMDELEPTVGASEQDVVRRADDLIRKEDIRICDHAKDPLDPNWDGELVVTDPDTMRWHRVKTTVGGPGTQTGGACR